MPRVIARDRPPPRPLARAHPPLPSLALALPALLGALAAPALASDGAAPATAAATATATATATASKTAAEGAAPHRTPLAGRRFETTLLGEPLVVEERDRGRTLALSLGATIYEPEIGETSFLPFGAFYGLYQGERARLRATIAVFYDEVDASYRVAGPFEALLHLLQNTIPFPSTEIIDNRKLIDSEIEWGSAEAWVGGGVRLPVEPGEIDSALRVQAFYHGGILYLERTRNTPPDLRLPPDTYVHGARLRVRHDGLLRNLLELPHEGLALGGDLEYGHRDRWRDVVTPISRFEADETRSYVKLSGYAVLAGGVPFLSERHRLVLYAHGGFAPVGTLDRFSAFRAGGGPFPSETDDLYRHPYPGALFNQFPIGDYIVGTLEYRLELLFFLYAHARATIAYGERPTIETGSITFRRDSGRAFSLGVTSGFLLDSVIYAEAAYDTGALRAGEPGGSFLFMWSKGF
jgi:hypothetical protein